MINFFAQKFKVSLIKKEYLFCIFDKKNERFKDSLWQLYSFQDGYLVDST